MQYEYAFEKLTIWKIARRVTSLVYVKTKSFPRDELFGITSQLRRAAVSVCCNLAEGSARINPPDQNRFYEMAFGSAVEMVNLLIITKDLGLVSDEDYLNLRKEMERLTYQINHLSGKRPKNN